MELLDDEGNLFGVVNVIDALVVLLVLAVVVAGAALVFGGEESQGPTIESTHVTLDLGQQPTYIVSEITAGDTYAAGPNSRLTLTDVYLTPQGGNTRVIVRAEVQAPVSEGGLSYGDAPLRLGRTLDIATNRYQVGGQIRAVGRNDTLTRSRTTVVLRDTLAAADAREVAPGDEIRLGGKTVATVQDVAVYATSNRTQRAVFVQATLRTLGQRGEQRFGGSPVRRGQTVRLSTASYTLAGGIERVGGGLERSRTGVVIEDVVPAETVSRLRAGDIVTVAGHDTARVESVTTYATRNPERTRVVVGASLQTLTYGEREQFGTVPVQRGRSVTLDTGQYTLSGPIQRVGTTEPRGSVTTRTVTLRMGPVREDMAQAINPGMTERSGNVTVGRVTEVEVEPSLIINSGENGSVVVAEHPFNREVLLTTELRVRQTVNGVQFKGRPLRQGQAVVIDLETIIVRATVVSVSG